MRGKTYAAWSLFSISFRTSLKREQINGLVNHKNIAELESRNANLQTCKQASIFLGCATEIGIYL
jgi:hypothetical protein